MGRAAFFGSAIVDKRGIVSNAMGIAQSSREEAGVYRLHLERPTVEGALVKTFLFEPAGAFVKATVDGSDVTLAVSPRVDARIFVVVHGPEEDNPEALVSPPRRLPQPTKPKEKEG